MSGLLADQAKFSAQPRLEGVNDRPAFRMPKLERGCGATEARRNPSPAIGQAINGDFPWLEVRCSRSG